MELLNIRPAPFPGFRTGRKNGEKNAGMEMKRLKIEKRTTSVPGFRANAKIQPNEREIYLDFPIRAFARSLNSLGAVGKIIELSWLETVRGRYQIFLFRLLLSLSPLFHAPLSALVVGVVLVRTTGKAKVTVTVVHILGRRKDPEAGIPG